MKTLKLTVLLLVVSSFCSAQELARYEVSGGFSYGGVDTSEIRSAKGFAGSFATNMNRWLAMETSVGAQFLTQSATLSGSSVTLSTGFYSFLSGPKISYRHGRVSPFAHGLFGMVRNLNYGKASYNLTNGTFAVPYQSELGAAAGGGVDYWITPRIALRTQGDYFLTQPDGTFGFHLQNNFRLVTGIVYTFGSTPSMTARMSRPQRPVSSSPARQDAIAKKAPALVSRPEPAATATLQTSAPMTTPAAPPQIQMQPPVNRPAEAVATVAVQTPAVVAKQSNAPAPVVAPRQDPFTPPAKQTNPVVNNQPATTVTMATATVRRPAVAQQPEQQFSLGEYARRIREKKEAQQGKDWN